MLDRLDEVDRRMGLDRVIPYVPAIVAAVMVASVLLAALNGDWIQASIRAVLIPPSIVGLRLSMSRRGRPTWPAPVDHGDEDS